MRALSKLLHQSAAEYGGQGEICCFQLVNLAQDFLQEHNLPAEDEEGEEPEPTGPESLWHEMQQREAAAVGAGDALEQSIRAGSFLASGAFDAFDGGLFSEAAEPAWAAPVAVARAVPTAVAPAVPTAAGPSAAASAAQPRAGKPPLLPPSRQVSLTGGLGLGAAASQPQSPKQLTPFAPRPADGEEAPRPQQQQAERSASGALGGSMLTSLRRAASAVLPRHLRKYLDGEPSVLGTWSLGTYLAAAIPGLPGCNEPCLTSSRTMAVSPHSPT